MAGTTVTITALKFERYTINPGLFFYGEKITANIGFSYITEDRTGGNMNYTKNGTVGYFEQNNTDRFTTQAQITQRLNEKTQFNFKNSYSRFSRFIQIPGYTSKDYSNLLFRKQPILPKQKKQTG